MATSGAHRDKSRGKPKHERSIVTKDGRVRQVLVDARAYATGWRNGQPLFTPELARVLCLLVKNGVSFEAAAGQCGITRRTLQRWKAEGEEVLAAIEAGTLPEGTELTTTQMQYAQLALDLQAALSVAESTATYRVMRAKDWKAQAWWLERRRPDLYSTREELRIGLATKRADEMGDAELINEMRALGFRHVPMLDADVVSEPTPSNGHGGNGHGGNGHGGNGHGG